MQVHDELVPEVRQDDVDAVAKQISSTDGNYYRLDVPFAGESGGWRKSRIGALRFA
ncbi:hypothetical protein ACLB1Q_20805 [Escherichia coli]